MQTFHLDLSCFQISRQIKDGACRMQVKFISI